MASTPAESPTHPDVGDFEHTTETDQSFENALQKARDGYRLDVDDAVALVATGTE